MKKRLVVIIRENLEEYIDFFLSVQKSQLYEVNIISYLDLFSSEYDALLKNFNVTNTLIAIDAAFYKKMASELEEYLSRVYEIPFKNLLHIFDDTAFYEERSVLQGSKHVYYTGGMTNLPANVHVFNLYISKVFSESVASFRLHDYITNSFEGVMHAELLKKKNEEIEHLNDELKRLNEELVRKNRIDSLTNLYNRATIFDFLDQERNRSNRGLWRIDRAIKSACGVNVPQYSKDYSFEPVGDLLDHYGVLSLMMIDVDRFKNINDTYGHLVGDEVLRYLGILMADREIFRENDVAGRFGGEEFLIILPDTNVNNALGPAMRLVKKLSEKEFLSNNHTKFNVTVSIGISQSNTTDKTREDIIRRTDEALYYAKEHGRNQIIVYEKVFGK